ncbi:MAG: 50S ribosomal protein L28 [Buchnera aphidicola (Nurudea shiraii)]
MSKVCQITGKKPMIGNHRSHAMNATKRRFFPNLHLHKFWDTKKNRFISLKVSAKGMRCMDKLGIDRVLKNTLLLKKRAYKHVKKFSK